MPALIAGWVAWAASHLALPAKRRQAEAEAAIALADGPLLSAISPGARHRIGPPSAVT